LQTPLFSVLGHTGCDAVAAAIDSRLRGTRQHGCRDEAERGDVALPRG
jgi:carbonic anhydrase